MSEDLAWRLRQVAQAYPESMFPEFTPEELKEHSMLISRASGNMGRFLSKHMIDGADEIDRLRAALEEISNVSAETHADWRKQWGKIAARHAVIARSALRGDA